MILRIIPLLLVIIPIIGFFYTPEPPSSTASGVHALANFLFTIKIVHSLKTCQAYKEDRRTFISTNTLYYNNIYTVEIGRYGP